MLNELTKFTTQELDIMEKVLDDRLNDYVEHVQPSEEAEDENDTDAYYFHGFGDALSDAVDTFRKMKTFIKSQKQE